MAQIQITTLPNGLRIITDTVSAVESVAVGVWVGVGTRDEDLACNGVAHMVEHMVFKGTNNRTAQQIVEIIENVGGHMNAYTSREITSYHIHLLKEEVPLALDVLADLIKNSTFPGDEIERERQVILQEINMSYDTPDDIIFDNFYEAAYPGQSLGAPILGKSEIIEKINRDQMMDYLRRFYTPGRMVICAAGNVKHEEFAARVEALFGDLQGDKPYEKTSAVYQGGENREERDLEQSHVILGFRGVSRLDEHYFTAQTLSTLLGGGMSSRLFQEVREKRGLAYSIFSFHSAYIDDGVMGVFAGTAPEKISELVDVITGELVKIAGNITEAELERAKAQLKSSTLMYQESMMNRADQHAKNMLFRGKLVKTKEIIDKISAVDLNAIDHLVQRIFSSSPTLAALGPLDHLADYEAIKAKLAG